MQSTSTTWKDIVQDGNFILNTRLVINGTTYTEISAPEISSGLFPGTLSVGNCTAACLKVSIRNAGAIPKSAAVLVEKQVISADRQTESEWISAGTFYICHREKDYKTGLLTLECYDAMLKANEPLFLDDVERDLTGWPLPMSTVVSYIAGRMGVQVDGRTTIRTESRYSISGHEGRTMMEILGFIGGVHGGNWIITPENKLRLVPLASAPEITEEIANRVWFQTDDGRSIRKVTVVDEESGEHGENWGYISDGQLQMIDHDPMEGIVEVSAILGSLLTTEDVTISRVTMIDDLESIEYTSGTDAGYTLRVDGNPYVTQEICDDLAQTLIGIEYCPLEMTQAIFDPAAELGDPIIYFDKARGILVNVDANMNVAFRARIEAPYEREAEDEYPYRSQQEKTALTAKQAAAAAEDAATKATNYLSRDDTGMMVANMTDGTRYTPSTVPSGIRNVYIHDDAVYIRNGTDVLASYGATTKIGPQSAPHIDITNGAVEVSGGSSSNDSVTMGAQAASTETRTDVYTVGIYDSSDEDAVSNVIEIALPYELSAGTITIDVGGSSTHTLTAGTSSYYDGTDYGYSYDGSYTITFTNKTSAELSISVQYPVNVLANYGLRVTTPGVSRIKVCSQVGQSVVSEGGLYTNVNNGRFGLYDAKHEQWFIYSDSDGKVKIPSLVPRLLSTAKKTAPSTAGQWTSLSIDLSGWAVIAIFARVQNAVQYLLFFSAASKSKQYLSDNPSAGYMRGCFTADWGENKISVKCVNGSAYQNVYFNQVVGLVRK